MTLIGARLLNQRNRIQQDVNVFDTEAKKHAFHGKQAKSKKLENFQALPNFAHRNPPREVSLERDPPALDCRLITARGKKVRFPRTKNAQNFTVATEERRVDSSLRWCSLAGSPAWSPSMRDYSERFICFLGTAPPPVGRSRTRLAIPRGYRPEIKGFRLLWATKIPQ
mgnify:CR=1 FL=1